VLSLHWAARSLELMDHKSKHTVDRLLGTAILLL